MNLTMYGTLAEALTEKHRAEGFPADKIPASLIGTDAAVYNRWRTGQMVPGDDRAADLAAYLEMPVNDMYALLARSRLERRNRNAAMPPTDRPVSRAEFDKLQEQFSELLHKLDALIESDEAPAPTGPDQLARSQPEPDPSGQQPRQK